MHIKRHVRTSKLDKFFRGSIHVPDSTGEEAKKGRGRARKRRGKGKGRRHDGRKGKKEDMGNSDWGELRHCS